MMVTHQQSTMMHQPPPLDAQGQTDLAVHGQEVHDNSAQRFDCDDTVFNLSYLFDVQVQEEPGV